MVELAFALFLGVLLDTLLVRTFVVLSFLGLLFRGKPTNLKVCCEKNDDTAVTWFTSSCDAQAQRDQRPNLASYPQPVPAQRTTASCQFALRRECLRAAIPHV